MGLETPKTPKRPEVKVKVPKFTKIELGGDRSDDVRQVEAKRKNAEKVKKEIDEIREGLDGLEEELAARELDEALAKLPSGKKVEAKPNVVPSVPKITETFGMGKAPAPKVESEFSKTTKVDLRSKKKKAGAVAEKPKKRGAAS